MIVDLLRRAGRFEEAVEQADAALGEAEGDVAAVLAFSRSLALARDPGRYMVEDAFSAGADETWTCPRCGCWAFECAHADWPELQ